MMAILILDPLVIFDNLLERSCAKLASSILIFVPFLVKIGLIPSNFGIICMVDVLEARTLFFILIVKLGVLVESL